MGHNAPDELSELALAISEQVRYINYFNMMKIDGKQKDCVTPQSHPF
jgi:hypothetical protein